MSRMPAVVAAVLMAASAVVAQSSVTVVKVSAKGDAVTRNEMVTTPVTKKVQVEEVVDGKKVIKTVDVTAYETQTVTVETKLKEFKATGTDGKAIAAEDLGKKLKAGDMAVMSFGKLDDDVRKVFKDGTVFLERLPATPK